MKFKMPLSQQLKEYRKRHSLTQEKLAHNLGCSTITLARWENEHNTPNKHYTKQILLFLNPAYEEEKKYIITYKHNGGTGRVQITRSKPIWDINNIEEMEKEIQKHNKLPGILITNIIRLPI